MKFGGEDRPDCANVQLSGMFLDCFAELGQHCAVRFTVGERRDAGCDRGAMSTFIDGEGECYWRAVSGLVSPAAVNVKTVDP